MATALRFNEGMKKFIQYGLAERIISYTEKIAVNIHLDEEYVGYITADGKITVGQVRAVPKPITFTETQWTAIALRAKEFKERCARVAQEQAQELSHDAMETPAALYAG